MLNSIPFVFFTGILLIFVSVVNNTPQRCHSINYDARDADIGRCIVGGDVDVTYVNDKAANACDVSTKTLS